MLQGGLLQAVTTSCSSFGTVFMHVDSAGLVWDYFTSALMRYLLHLCTDALLHLMHSFMCTDAKARPCLSTMEPSNMQSSAQLPLRPTWQPAAAATKLTLPSISTGMMKSGLGTGLKEECTRVSSRSSTRHCLRRFAES